VKVERTRAAVLGVLPAAIYAKLQTHLRSQYVNDFNYENQVFRVLVQDPSEFRQRIDDIDRLYVLSAAGALVPLRSLVTARTVQGTGRGHSHYNLYPSVLINGQATPGVNLGQAIAAMEQVAAERRRPASAMIGPA
jgi:multidrug efflux pump subunit AcrB